MGGGLRARIDGLRRELSASPARLASRTLVLALLAGLAGIAAGQFISSDRSERFAETHARGSLQQLAPGNDRPAPGASFEASDGAPVKLTDWRGRVLLVNLWATWCPPCLEELPGLAGLARAYEPEGLAVVAIAAESAAAREEARAMLARLTGDTLDFYLDTDWAVARDAGVHALPVSLLIDRRGHELARLSGAADWSSPEARRLVEAALAR